MRAAEGCFVVEGAKAIGVALDSGAVPESVYLGPEATGDGAIAAVVDRAHDRGASVFPLGPGVVERISDTVSPQPVVAVLRCHDVELDTLVLDRRPDDTAAAAPDSLLVVCADVRDPGNAGTILRSAAGAGAQGVVFCDGSVDAFNPKTVRASAGSLFQIAVVAGGDPVDVLGMLGGAGFRLLGTAARGGTDYDACNLTGRVALVLGNEAAGLDDRLASLLESTVTVPMAGGVESLNVGMAAAVICFEAARQKRRAGALL